MNTVEDHTSIYTKGNYNRVIKPVISKADKGLPSYVN